MVRYMVVSPMKKNQGRGIEMWGKMVIFFQGQAHKESNI